MANGRVRVADVAPDVPVSGIAESYSYLIPDAMDLARGDAALIPFGGRTVVGYVLGTRCVEAGAFDFELKPISSVIAGLSLPDGLMETLEFLSARFLAPLGAAVSVAMPPGVRSRLTTAYQRTEATPEDLTSPQREVLRFVEERGGRVAERSLWAKKLTRSSIAALVKKGLLTKIVELPPERKKGPKSLLLADENKVREFIERESSKKPAQAAVLLALLDAPRVGLSPNEIAVLGGVTDSAVMKLVEAGLLVEETAHEEHNAQTKQLNDEQQAAYEELSASIRSGEGGKFLLHGVTGSGKTEVYLRAVADTLTAGNQALYLVPEIALTAQVVGQLRERFGPNVAIMHSGLSEGERLRHWRRARNGDAPVVIGARSAVFAPLDNLGLIVVDEEHEGSYKQDSTPRYHLRDLAEFRATQSNATLVLGSATPSVESYYRAQSGEYRLLALTKRAVALRLPDVQVTDLREVFKEGKPSIIGPLLREELVETLARGEQVILFINRRAYAHSLLCRDCGHVPRCPNCSVSLTFHRGAKRLRCHHCGLNTRAPDTCPVCSSLRLRPLGLGTEKVEEVVRAEFPDVSVARLDRDIARRKGAVEEVFAKLREGEIQVLVGTQMIAKGLDFPNVTLVGVIAADTGLSVPDFRSTERTFQLLTQVSGRAGRRKPGKVVIQSFQPEHPAVRFAAAQDYLDFYFAEIAEREGANYPPFIKLVNVIATSTDNAAAEAAIRQFSEGVAGLPGIECVGPTDCPIGRLHGKWRKHVLLKVEKGENLGEVERAREGILDRSVQITIDVDPNSLL